MKIKNILAIVVSAMILIFAVLTILLPKEEYSESENRHLEEVPEYSLEEMMNGKYVEKIEKYLTDHFVGRDLWMTLYENVQKFEGATEVNGVYLCSDGYLIEKNKEYMNLDKIINNFNGLYSKVKEKNPDINMSVMLVPTSISYNYDKLPENAVVYSQYHAMQKIKSNLVAGIKYIESFDMKNQVEYADKYKDYQMYYKTDHHWTTYGAFFAYESYCKANGIENFKMTDYNIKSISNDFYGTVFSKVNDKNIDGDEMVCFEKDRDLDIMYQNGPSKSLYNAEYLLKKDKYSYFLNNINDKIVIENNGVHNGKVLLVAKDSYANCFVPFLTDHYEKIIVLDTRYYMYGVSGVIEKENVTDILLLFNMNTIDTDAAINGIY